MIYKKKLKDISLHIGSGITPRRDCEKFWLNGEIDWLKTEQLGEKHIYDANEKISQLAIDETTIKIFPVNTLSIAMYGEGRTRGNVSILKKRMTTNQACCNIVLNDQEVDYEYVYYFIKTQYQHLRDLSSGVRNNLNSNDIKELKINLPSNIKEQKKIAAVLSALDAKIELNQRINAELEAMAKTIYDYWFVQFDFPDEHGEPYKSSGGKMVWSEALKREIPAGWEVKGLGNYAQPIRGVTYKKEEVKNSSDKDTIPILRATNINNAVIDLHDMVYVPAELVAEDQILDKFDVLITMSSGSKAHVGKNAFYYFDKKVSFGAFCSRLSVKKNLRFYVNTHMQSDNFKKYIANVGLGTNINNLTNRHITEYKLLIPSEKLLLKYEEIVENFYNEIGNNIKESQTLTELRDWLLPMLMNGQVTVKTQDDIGNPNAA